jgi:hypothetical protein
MAAIRTAVTNIQITALIATNIQNSRETSLACGACGSSADCQPEQAPSGAAVRMAAYGQSRMFIPFVTVGEDAAVSNVRDEWKVPRQGAGGFGG